MIRISDYQFRYPDGDFTLLIGELCVSVGERAALIGPSGCGKSTLLQTIAGILRPERGRVEIGGSDLFALSEGARRRFRACRIGLVFQDFQLLDYLSVKENILLPYILHPTAAHAATRMARLIQLVDAVGLSDKLKRRPGTLSHGERQRVALCRSLITEPDLVLADEPTASLDADTADLTIRLLLDDAKQRGSTLLTVTHDRTAAAAFDRVLDLRTITDGAELASRGGTK